MKEENFKKQIISKVEIFLREITQKPADVNSKTIFSSLNDLEYFFEILTNYIQAVSYTHLTLPTNLRE